MISIIWQYSSLTETNVNNNLLHYCVGFMSHFSIGATNYYIRNPDLQLLKIRHKFPRSLLGYQ